MGGGGRGDTQPADAGTTGCRTADGTGRRTAERGDLTGVWKVSLEATRASQVERSRSSYSHTNLVKNMVDSSSAKLRPFRRGKRAPNSSRPTRRRARMMLRKACPGCLYRRGGETRDGSQTTRRKETAGSRGTLGLRGGFGGGRRINACRGQRGVPVNTPLVGAGGLREAELAFPQSASNSPAGVSGSGSESAHEADSKNKITSAAHELLRALASSGLRGQFPGWKGDPRS